VGGIANTIMLGFKIIMAFGGEPLFMTAVFKSLFFVSARRSQDKAKTNGKKSSNDDIQKAKDQTLMPEGNDLESALSEI
jgi:hypothetical protein